MVYYFLYDLQKRSRSDVTRKQARLLLVGAFVSITLASVSDLILPLLNVHSLPNIAPTFVMIFAGAIMYAIARFRLIATEQEFKAEAERQWSETFNAMTDAVSIHDLDYNIVNVNTAMGQLLNKSGNELIGQKCYQVFHCAYRPVAGCPMEKALVSRKAESVEVFEPVLNRWLAVSTAPVFDRDNRLVRIIHVVRDVTAGKRAEETASSLAAIVTSSDDAIIGKKNRWDDHQLEQGGGTDLRLFGAGDHRAEHFPSGPGRSDR
jgi:PAS domain S-box-containing protein